LQLDGLAMMPRTIDKLRASLPGGNMGDYRIDGFSRRMLEMLGITEEQLRDAIASAKSDEDVSEWLREHADTSKYEEFTQYISKRSIDDVKDKEAFMKRYPILERRPDIYYLADMLEADDAEAFK
jgi:lipopolysaccharide biosynthesis regulator YciM